MIKVTPNAVNQLQEILAAKDLDATTHGLRLGVEKGGCAGMQYTMRVGLPEPEDELVESSGVRVFLAPESLGYLRDSEIDYVDDLAGSGFRIRNPNAARSCGCGTSFETSPEASAGAS